MTELALETTQPTTHRIEGGGELDRKTYWDLCQAVGLDEERYNLTAPFYDGQSIVATDGFRLHWVEVDMGSNDPHYLEKPAKPLKADWKDPAKLSRADMEAVLPKSWRESVHPKGVEYRPADLGLLAKSKMEQETAFTPELLRTLDSVNVCVLMSEMGMCAMHTETYLPRKFVYESIGPHAVALDGHYFAEAMRFASGPAKKHKGETYHLIPNVRIGGTLDPVHFELDGRKACVMPRKY